KKKLSLPEYRLKQYAQLSLSEGAVTATEEELLQQIYTDQLATGKINRKYLFALAGQLEDAVRTGVGSNDIDYNAPDHLFQSLLEANVQHFSAAKSLALTQQLNQIKNRSRSFSEFRSQAEPLLSNYNVNWMRAEYNHAVAAAQNGATWMRMKQAADVRPYWEYQTVGDDRVRPTHQSMDGLIFRIDDPEAARVFPPNGFGCRCEGVSRADLAGREVSSLQDAIGALGSDWQTMNDKGFAVNFGDAAQVFTRSQDYAQGIDPNTLTWRSYNLKSATAMKKLPALQAGTMAARELERWWKDRRGRHDLDEADRIRLLDYRDRPILMDRNLVDDLKERKQAALLNLLEDLLTNPDEVWLQENPGTLQRLMLKFFRGRALLAGIAFGNDHPEQLLSLTVVDLPDLVRAGILTLAKR
ncbi:phage head morphogenesis protein, partial [Flavilitoribacter nigricans]